MQKPTSAYGNVESPRDEIFIPGDAILISHASSLNENYRAGPEIMRTFNLDFSAKATKV